MRVAKDEKERSEALASLGKARDLMMEALSILDDTPVLTDCDAYLDQALHDLSRIMEGVHGGAGIFLDGPRSAAGSRVMDDEDADAPDLPVDG